MGAVVVSSIFHYIACTGLLPVSRAFLCSHIASLQETDTVQEMLSGAGTHIY